MRESKNMRKVRINKILDILAAVYPDAKPQLNYTTPFELLVATILSAQCTDKQVNKCTAELFKLYSKPEQFARLSESELKEHIKGCGLANNKSKNIIAASKLLVNDFGGNIPAERETLMALPGVGRKTANVVLSNAFGIPAIAVDTHVFRVSNRIGLADSKTVEGTEAQLMQNIPRDKWSIAHHWLIYHGRSICIARNPKCGECPINSFCKEYIKNNGIR